MIVPTVVWALTQRQTSGGFERRSAADHGQPADWEPWILYVALVWGLVVAIVARKTYFDRPTTDTEIRSRGQAAALGRLDRMKP